MPTPIPTDYPEYTLLCCHDYVAQFQRLNKSGQQHTMHDSITRFAERILLLKRPQINIKRVQGGTGFYMEIYFFLTCT